MPIESALHNQIRRTKPQPEVIHIRPRIKLCAHFSPTVQINGQ
jgi:hypothetical protein